MTKDEGSGLFSKVVKFVRNPGTGWTDGDQDSDHESAYSKQMLKEMIERKRRNDFVRKREFDMLRKMRRSEVMAGQDPAARPSFFQSSMPSKPDDRASTLKKIDEIEAQMSMQWWKTKHGGADALDRAGSSTNFPMSSLPQDSAPRQSEPPAFKAPPSATSYSRTEPSPLAPMSGKATPPPEAEAMMEWDEPGQPDSNDEPTVAIPLEARPQPPAPPPPAPASDVRPPLAMFSSAAETTPPSGGFTASKVFAVDADKFAHDPELEEASIRFANGDDDGTEAGLMDVLGPGGARIEHDETWLTLFDLYRAVGRQDRFETAAIDFARRFGRSAPQWISLPEEVRRMGAAAPAAAAAAPGGKPGQVAHWNCPSSMGTQTLAALNAALARVEQPWKLSWSKLKTIEEPALEGLSRLFAQWVSQPVQLRFIGADDLERVLKAATPSGDKSVDPAWWKLRMEVLRVTHRPDEFELVALDYCVTYEVSPPSWESARCDYKALQADGSAVAGQTIVGDAFHDSMQTNLPGYGDSAGAALSGPMSQVATVELAGQILGDANEALALLEGKLAGADVMVISCARLIRIDFTAAGSLLNWVSAREAEGRQVQFAEVHRLVAAFFNVIGISEHARVVVRRD